MSSYFYPTEPGWFEELLSDWKNTGKRYISFPFSYNVKTLPQETDTDFWMYIYYTKNLTKDPKLTGTVPFRVHVIHHGFKPKPDDLSTHVRGDWSPETGTFFIVDIAQQIRHLDGSYMLLEDFEHSEGKALPQAIISSIASVRRIVPMIVVDQCMRELHD